MSSWKDFYKTFKITRVLCSVYLYLMEFERKMEVSKCHNTHVFYPTTGVEKNVAGALKRGFYRKIDSRRKVALNTNHYFHLVCIYSCLWRCYLTVSQRLYFSADVRSIPLRSPDHVLSPSTCLQIQNSAFVQPPEVPSILASITTALFYSPYIPTGGWQRTDSFYLPGHARF